MSTELQWKCLHFDNLSLKELYDIMVLRQEVFVVEQDCPYIDCDGKDIVSWHVCGYDSDGDLVGYTRIVPKGISYEKYPSIGRVVTSAKIRGKKKGRELMQVSIDYLRELQGNDPIKISAQSHLQKYYGSLGFVTVTDEYDEDGIPHVGMLLK